MYISPPIVLFNIVYFCFQIRALTCNFFHFYLCCFRAFYFIFLVLICLEICSHSTFLSFVFFGIRIVLQLGLGREIKYDCAVIFFQLHVQYLFSEDLYLLNPLMPQFHIIPYPLKNNSNSKFNISIMIVMMLPLMEY